MRVRRWQRQADSAQAEGEASSLLPARPSPEPPRECAATPDRPARGGGVRRRRHSPPPTPRPQQKAGRHGSAMPAASAASAMAMRRDGIAATRRDPRRSGGKVYAS